MLVQGKKDEAISGLEAAIKANPENLAAYLSIAQIYVQGKDYKKAMETYERVLARKPDLWVAANDLAFLMADTGGDLDKAMGFAQKALTQRPEEPSVLDTVGWIYYKKGDSAKAIEYPGTSTGKVGREPQHQLSPGDGLREGGKDGPGQGVPEEGAGGGSGVSGERRSATNVKGNVRCSFSLF